MAQNCNSQASFPRWRFRWSRREKKFPPNSTDREMVACAVFAVQHICGYTFRIEYCFYFLASTGVRGVYGGGVYRTVSNDTFCFCFLLFCNCRRRPQLRSASAEAHRSVEGINSSGLVGQPVAHWVCVCVCAFLTPPQIPTPRRVGRIRRHKCTVVAPFAAPPARSRRFVAYGRDRITSHQTDVTRRPPWPLEVLSFGVALARTKRLAGWPVRRSYALATAQTHHKRPADPSVWRMLPSIISLRARFVRWPNGSERSWRAHMGSINILALFGINLATQCS